MNNELMNTIVTSVSTSLERLYEEDGASLISKIIPPEKFEKITTQEKKDYQHAAERAIVFRWAYYLNTLLEPEFKAAQGSHDNPYTIDLEYNRHNFGRKQLQYKSIYPDLIIHRRDTPDNLLVVECKGWWNHNNDEIDKDKNRLRMMTKRPGEYEYHLGLFIKFEKELRNLKNNSYWYQDGHEYRMEESQELIAHGEL
nr:hypothetical protein [uncultured Agathobaculum sp.]